MKYRLKLNWASNDIKMPMQFNLLRKIERSEKCFHILPFKFTLNISLRSSLHRTAFNSILWHILRRREDNEILWDKDFNGLAVCIAGSAPLSPFAVDSLPLFFPIPKIIPRQTTAATFITPPIPPPQMFHFSIFTVLFHKKSKLRFKSRKLPPC